ncbi:MAG: zinc ribbon domain-containing protein [Proteobacteria bacterium]|nr:zinc ribbon domain-containing protein [Pseudomonadota bacterium]
MPTYEYLCENCGYQFEKEQRITEDPLKECPQCKGVVKRLISNGNFILKGGGWYVTDYSRTSTTGSSVNSKPACGESQACQNCPSAK